MAITREGLRRKQKNSRQKPLLNPDWLIVLSLFTLFGILSLIICFAGLAPFTGQVLPNQIAHKQIRAAFPFSYESVILTAKAKEQREKQVPPVFQLEMDAYSRFEAYVDKLADTLDASPASLETLQLDTLEHFLVDETLFEKRYDIDGQDLAILFKNLEQGQRGQSLREALGSLRLLYRQGIYDNDHPAFQKSLGGARLYTLEETAISGVSQKILSRDAALRELRRDLRLLLWEDEVTAALFRIIRLGLSPNLSYSQEKTEASQRIAVEKIEPIIVQISMGEVLIEAGSRISPLQFEKLNAFRQKQSEQSSRRFDFRLFGERIFITLSILTVVAFFLFIGNGKKNWLYRELLFCGVTILINFVLFRLFIEVGKIGLWNDNLQVFLSTLPYLSPTLFGGLIIAILLGVRLGIMTAAIVCMFNAIMHENSIILFLTTFLSALVAVYFCQNVQSRSRIVRASVFSGFTLAACIFLIGLYKGLDPVMILQQMGVAFSIAMITGIIVVSLLPFLEKVFQCTTNISLLELTDFNHPLLRRMQMEAPGSYHHSLMVANLSERAALDIGANPLICRVGGLYHDVGKITKPEYFVENQRQMDNPHLQHNPSISALVLKSHVKEGETLAKQYKLPKVIIDIINQHHGTTLIQYFYHQAVQRQQSEEYQLFLPELKSENIDETPYRYEGPKPQFKESVIIFLADSIEAASRSLPKVTHQAIDELLQKIFWSRINDGQLCESPLTFEELNKVKDSFTFTLLNMGHSRIEYPAEEKKEANNASGTIRKIKSFHKDRTGKKPISSHLKPHGNI